MKSRVTLTLAALLAFSLSSALAAPGTANPAGEYSKHFDALAKLSIAVAQAMPPDQYAFRPHPDSMTFGQLMSHIATTNYQFCAGLKDSDSPVLPSPTGKDATVKFLSDSFDYCSGVIPNLEGKQIDYPHPAGNLTFKRAPKAEAPMPEQMELTAVLGKKTSKKSD